MPDPDDWFEVSCDGEAIVSFDWVTDVDATIEPISEWESVYCMVRRDFTVDGREGFGWVPTSEDTRFTYVKTPSYESSSEKRHKMRVFLTPGKHILRWSSLVTYAYNCNCRVSVENFTVEERPVAKRDNLASWLKLIVDFRIWKPDNLAYLSNEVYSARIAVNPNDYEARILRAATTLGMLAENPKAHEVLSDCGYTVEAYTMKLLGEFVGWERAPMANDEIDKVAPEVIRALDEALRDLAAIPDNWNGSISLDPKKYDCPGEPVLVDLAEVMVVRSALEGAKASVLLVQGYDFEADYVALSNALATAETTTEILAAAPKVGCVRDIKKLGAAKEIFRSALKHIQRADQIILWRTNPQLHLFEYDIVDTEHLSRARSYLAQAISSLDHPETLDLPYLANRVGVSDDILPGGMFRQVYLGAIFSGKITRDLVPEVELRPVCLHIDKVPDVTVGGLAPDFAFEDFAAIYPGNQSWPIAFYLDLLPATTLLKGQSLEVIGEADFGGKLDYTVDMVGCKPGCSVSCVIDGEVVDVVSNVSARVRRSIDIPERSEYRLVFYSAGDNYFTTPFVIDDYPSECAKDGEHTETTPDGITWKFDVVGGQASVKEAEKAGGTISGDVTIPAELAGCPVASIGEMVFIGKTSACSFDIPETVTNVGQYAFFNCNSAHRLVFHGGEPTVGDYAFFGLAQDCVVAIPKGAGWNVVEGKWQGMTVEYLPGLDESIIVTPSLPNNYEFVGSTTLTLSSPGNRTIYYTANGSTPTHNSQKYTSPISVSSTTAFRYFAVDEDSGDWGPEGGVTLILTVPDFSYIDSKICSTTHEGVKWAYRQQGSQVALVSDPALDQKYRGDVQIPRVVNWSPVSTIGEGLFEGSWGMVSVTIPDTVKVIESDAFRECLRLTSVELPEGLESIGDSAFERCASLRSVSIPSTVTNIGYFAFRDCLRLTNVTLRGEAPHQDLGVYLGVPAFTTISGRLGSATAIVYTEITNETAEVTVPKKWLDELQTEFGIPPGYSSYEEAFNERFGSDFEKAIVQPTGKFDLTGKELRVWQDYVAGTNPLDEEDVFTAIVTIENELPIISWSPELSPERAKKRIYMIYGKTVLSGLWTDITELSPPQRRDLGFQFFKVSVRMVPENAY